MQNDILKLLTEIAHTERTPEEEAALIAKLAKTLPTSFVSEARKTALAQKAQEYSIEGYKAFYELIHGRTPPAHVVREVEEFISADSGTIIFAWRGSWKTVSITVTFLVWFVGLFPEKTNLIICSSEDNAKKITIGAANIVDFHPEYSRAFPYIKKSVGSWSFDGFSVVDTRVSMEEWQKKQAAAIDPTFMGLGYDSLKINGRHPTGLLLCDDLHNEKNSASEKMRQEVINIVLKVILKTAVKDKDKFITKIGFIGTPWAEDDAPNILKKTGEFKFISIPAARRAKEGEAGAVYCDGKNKDGIIFTDIVGWWVFTWPDGYGLQSFITDRALLGMRTFWQMILLDLVTSENAKLKYYQFPNNDIDYSWVTCGGADPTTFIVTGNQNSHFALAYLSKLPTGGAVVVDGVLEKCSQTAAENYILYAQGRFENWMFTAVENVGVGKMFLQTLYKNPNIRAIPSGLKNISDATVSSKKDRAMHIHKWFEDGTIRISDADTSFLNALRRLFDRFHDLDPTDYAFDAADAVFHALKNMPEVLTKKDTSVFPAYQALKRKNNPLQGMNVFSGYGRN